jgi:hypothetical protein
MWAAWDHRPTSHPIAHGRAWYRQARYFAAPFQRPFVALRRITGHTRHGEACTILMVDNGAPLRRLLARILVEQTESVPLGRTAVLAVPAMLRREQASYDLVLARIPRVLAERSYPSSFLCLPWVVDMWVRTEEVAARRLRSDHTVTSAYARFKRQGFVVRQRSGPADLDQFYDTMYLPFARARFGEAASPLSRAVLRRSLACGTISWLDWDGRPVAAGLSERHGTVLHAIAAGTSLELATAREAHVLSAVRVANSNLAMDTGCEWIGLGGCMPWLTDGALQNKRHWGAGLVHRPELHRMLLASWTRWTPAAAALLDLAPVCRHGSGTFAVTTAAPHGQLPVDKLALPGIDRLLVVQQDGAAPGADGAGSAVGIQRVRPGGTAEMLAQADL